jgi:hypothetical protein
MRSKATILPGDHSTAFQRQRLDLFRTHQPLTAQEAACVERMAKLQWRMERCDRWQDRFDDQLDALMEGDPGRDSPLCEPDSHYSLHRVTDCAKHDGRLARHKRLALRELLELQRMRRLNLLPGAIAVAASYLEFLLEGNPASAEKNAPGPSAAAAATTPSDEREIGKSDEQIATPPASGGVASASVPDRPRVGLRNRDRPRSAHRSRSPLDRKRQVA